MPLCLSPSPIGLCSESSASIPPPSSSFFAIAVGPSHKLVSKAHPCDASAEVSCSLSKLSFLKGRPGLRWIPESSRFVQPPRVCASLFASSSIAQRSGLAEKAKYEKDAKVIQVHTIREFDDALSAAESKLVVVEYAASHSPNSRKIYPSMVEMSMRCRDAVFLLVMGDESEETKDLCKRVGIEKVPHFIFYKNKEIVHEEGGIGPDELLGDVLYYGDPDAPILQLHSKKDVDELMEKHAADGKLLVLDVGLKHCGPCVKVYPTFVALAKKMKEMAVFARMNGDENEETMEFLKQMDVVQVPTFLFIKDGKISGRYVGSGKGELIGEILRYQGVRVTY